MPLFYKPVQSSIASEDGIKKWHPRLVKVGRVIDTQKIGDIIAEKSSLTPGDVHNVIRNLVTVMRDQLQNSRTVCLEGLGSFTMISHSSGSGVDVPEEVNPSQINRLSIRFTPTGIRNAGKNGVTRSMYSGVEYERWFNTDVIQGDGGENSGNGGSSIDPLG